MTGIFHRKNDLFCVFTKLVKDKKNRWNQNVFRRESGESSRGSSRILTSEKCQTAHSENVLFYFLSDVSPGKRFFSFLGMAGMTSSFLNVIFSLLDPSIFFCEENVNNVSSYRLREQYFVFFHLLRNKTMFYLVFKITLVSMNKLFPMQGLLFVSRY